MVISTYLSLPFNSSNNKVNTHFIIKSVYVNILVLFYYVSRFEIFLESQFPKRTLTQSYTVDVLNRISGCCEIRAKGALRLVALQFKS